MQLVDINLIKADPDQPRRTFNAEKMQALEASMRADGFRPDYPIIIDNQNIIVDGERRWRAAKAAGITQVPVVVKTVKNWERLLYQLQSEGSELELIDRNKAWVSLWENAKQFVTRKAISDRLGVPASTFKRVLNDYETYTQALSKLKPNTSAADVSYETLVELGKEDSEFVNKAVKENWSRDKTREIKKAIEERPLRKQQILQQDYTDPYPNSNQWKLRLEVAKSDVDIEELEYLDKTRQNMQEQVDAFDRIIEYGLKMVAAMKMFDYTKVTPQTRTRLHQHLSKIFPYSPEWVAGLTKYMITNGEITNNNAQIEGEKNVNI